MTFLDKLSSLIKIDASKLRKFNILSNNTLKDFVSIHNTTVNLNISGAIRKEKELVDGFLRETLKENNLIIENKAKALLDDFNKIDKSDRSRSIIDYFRGKILPSDLDILRASIYVKEVFDRGESVRDLKFDLVSKYGQRGNNISNLYSAGYFDSLIKPIYEEMYKLPEFSGFKFLERFEVIVTQYTFAVFVSATRDKKDIKKEILDKIKLNKKYGIHKLNIHGIGIYNVQRIREILSEIDSVLFSIPELSSGVFYINATITF